ncbi:hypothetical protein ElyMa_002287700 [Elysia marginata]|uniref:Secreted protein n=1 Tax=Elysia marginata TaxID=1093978 RepID=A0AAV4G1K4_9GAST|nr:hypothetical protein ElyMa_002287700 [Elysia marginata]
MTFLRFLLPAATLPGLPAATYTAPAAAPPPVAPGNASVICVGVDTHRPRLAASAHAAGHVNSNNKQTSDLSVACMVATNVPAAPAQQPREQDGGDQAEKTREQVEPPLLVKIRYGEWGGGGVERNGS